ncbi:uncharacterized protein Eint_070950 [Encephalitozoon intestinalis ATCC 50506]|uniref:Uncharacterized protein n=1 Tax=Encephalitozoon intestinalis (strain ATCC 50506) TaxID=876142 RepID=E0S823_ENCIT|nr:uncharacterized protein Eint_070950 [Encephalitozoon intestinalis ATCC 50506]ADM11858.1 hypothetical protein Eint_070950 [Encephalitozoon intestinalis ATCC 50506]UTX45612.1 hypothetical protein GPK93_07g11770 [Encephalitozoon intestinalis]
MLLLFFAFAYSFQRGYGPCGRSNRHLRNSDYDGVMMLNVLHRNQPLTVFDTIHPERISLPALLSEFSKEMMENQVFDLKYESFSKKVWLELKKERCIEIADVHSSLKGVRMKISPSSIYLKRLPNSVKFQLISEGKCLTVGNEINYEGVSGWALSFTDCNPGDNSQTFVMIPSLKAVLKLNEKARTRKMIHKMYDIFRKIEKIIGVVDITRLRRAPY